ncbi:hypothetical protein [Alysiella crassa]|nr:hypothetical protein [Alysiella crassa]UOP06602.1 hypothetical protein LVJ80_12745 [Alysiella crassa]
MANLVSGCLMLDFANQGKETGSLSLHDNFDKHPRCRVRTTHQIIQIT